MNKFELEEKLDKLKINLKHDTEVWKPVLNFEEYEISSFGRVKSLTKVIYRFPPNRKTSSY